MRHLVLAIDQGSSATKSAILDPRTGDVLAAARAPLRAFTPRSILGSVRAAVAEAVGRVPGAGGASFTLGITNQRTTLLFLDEAGRPGRAIIPWWEPSGDEPGARTEAERRWFRARTGLPLLGNWWAGKLGRHLREHGASRTGDRPATVDTMLIAWMSGGRTYATDLSNAARTGLVDLATGRRTQALRAFFGIPRGLDLAEIRESLDDYGDARIPLGGGDPWPHGNPQRVRGRIGAVVGDAGAGLMGMTGGARGVMTLTLGTGGFLHLPCRRETRASEGVYRAPAWKAGGRTCWALEAAIPGMARAFEAGLEAARMPRDAMTSCTPRRPPGSLGVILAPDGLGALGPEGIRGIHLEGNWTRASSEERLGAIYDGMALLVARAVARFPERPRILVASGGVSRSPYLIARIADFTGIPVGVADSADATLRGAAMLAARATGHRIPPLPIGRATEPRLAAAERRVTRARFERRLDALSSPATRSGR